VNNSIFYNNSHLGLYFYDSSYSIINNSSFYGNASNPIRNYISTDIRYYGEIKSFGNVTNSLYGTFVAGNASDPNIS
jgi:hypothetical protein